MIWWYRKQSQYPEIFLTKNIKTCASTLSVGKMTSSGKVNTLRRVSRILTPGVWLKMYQMKNIFWSYLHEHNYQIMFVIKP